VWYTSYVELYDNQVGSFASHTFYNSTAVLRSDLFLKTQEEEGVGILRAEGGGGFGNEDF